MSTDRVRNGCMCVALVILTMTVLGGCAHADAAALEMFVTDFLRNAAAAALL